MRRLARLLLLSAALVLAVTYTMAKEEAGIFLPGTQPETVKVEEAEPKRDCRACHGRTANGKNDPYFSWRGGMMAHAALDPVFLAARAVANQDVPGVGEFCNRCHAPSGWLAGRSKPPNGAALNKNDKAQGVGCALCHRLVDPRSQEAKKLVRDVPPGFGNAMMVVGKKGLYRGPYPDPEMAAHHTAMKSGFQASSQLCGTCHDVSNPLAATNVRTQAPHAYGHIERTFSEWELSAFNGTQTCQSCHYEPVPGGGKSTRSKSSRHRDHFVPHGPTGGSTWTQDALAYLWKGKFSVDVKALAANKKKARRLLARSASLKVTVTSPQRAVLRVTNLTGHKLPTGYPEGRRMWVNVRYLDAKGKVLEEVGRYGTRESTVFGQPVNVPDLLDPDRTRVYEIKPGLSPARAKKQGLTAGPSFHFVLNDTVFKDNRIPPKGFTNKAFAARHCAPVGARYADGQHWDDVPLAIPPGCTRIEVRLMYQSVSWEYIRFLAQENRTDDWGKRLYEAWNHTGKCPPEAIAQIEQTVP